jgi:CheY-like chemotaxis protein
MSGANLIRSVLIADDDADDQMLLEEVITDFDPSIKITVVADGLQLMHYLNTNPVPDLLLLDLNMPYKNGIDCLDEIRTNNALSKIPVVILTTSKASRDIEQCYNSGANLFLSKPCTFEGLKKTIHGTLSINWTRVDELLDKREFLRIATEGDLNALYQEA